MLISRKHVQARKIKPLRKARLAGKKPAVTTSADQTQQDATILHQPQDRSVSTQPAPDVSKQPLQLNPADILNRAQEQQRVSSNSSVSTIDSLLDGHPSRQQVFPAGPGGVLALPLNAVEKRTVSGSSAEDVDAIFNSGEGSKGVALSNMVPMFNFHPPTPSNAGFDPCANSAAQAILGTYTRDIFQTPYQFEPIDLRTMFGPVAEGSTDHVIEALKDTDDLDYEAFLTSPGTSAESSPEVAQGSFKAGPPNAVEAGQDGVPRPTVNTTQIKYIFDQMDAQSKGDDGMDIDPAIFEMLKGILMGNAAGQEDNLDTTENVPPPPHPAPVVDDSTFTSRPLSEYDPSLSALAIDLSALMSSSPRGSLCVQTTPSDVSEMTAFEDFGGEEVSPTQRHDTDAPGSDADRLSPGDDEEVVDWEGLFDFDDMLDAFWKMVDGKEGGGSAGQSVLDA